MHKAAPQAPPGLVWNSQGLLRSPVSCVFSCLPDDAGNYSAQCALCSGECQKVGAWVQRIHLCISECVCVPFCKMPSRRRDCEV